MNTRILQKESNDISFSDFIKLNYGKIISNTPINPSLSKNDEWREENIWDELFEELSK